MIHISVHIANEIDFMPKDVSVIIRLPSVPRIGERLFLSKEIQSQLEDKARSSLDIAEKYINYFYRFSHGINEVKEINLKDLSFDEASLVSDVVYESDCETVFIELSKF